MRKNVVGNISHAAECLFKVMYAMYIIFIVLKIIYIMCIHYSVGSIHLNINNLFSLNCSNLDLESYEGLYHSTSSLRTVT